MKKALNLYKKNIKYIHNSFKYDINNGIIEGKNNLVKCLKRIAFGYRKYVLKISRASVICDRILGGLVYAIRILEGGQKKKMYFTKMAKNNPNFLKL